MTRKMPGESAVVIGGSIAGLLTARVLADHYLNVTILERDDLSLSEGQRKGTPQGRHAHALLAGGQRAIEQLFPGISDHLVSLGAVRGHGRFFSGGGYHARLNGGPGGLFVSRPLLETEIRRRVREIPNVTLLDCVDVQGLERDSSRTRVTGVRVTLRSERLIDNPLWTDLVVDCSGRGSQAPAWLAALGFTPPDVEHVDVGMGYSTRLYRRDPDHLQGDAFVNIAPTVDNLRASGMLAQEGNRWIVTLAGYHGEHPPTDPEGFLRFAQRLPVPDVYNVIRSAEPLSEPVAYRFQANQWRHYERLTHFPEGFLVLGDAIASFTPIYGQGMTVSALEAQALARCLDSGTVELAPRFFATARQIIGVAWSITVGNDLKLSPHDRRRVTPRAVDWYLGQFQIAARHDPVLAGAFLQVANFLAKPPSLLHPRLAMRVLRVVAPGRERRAEHHSPRSQPASS